MSYQAYLTTDSRAQYLSPGKASSGLTKTLLRLIRQQRHLAMRILISTQGTCIVERVDLRRNLNFEPLPTEPTVVPPVLLDLCSVTILHRFTSPSWWQHLIQHVSADFSKSDAFDHVVKLQTGHALILAPAGLGVFPDEPAEAPSGEGEEGNGEASRASPAKSIGHIGRRYLIMKTRRRITTDGGASILAVSDD